MHSQKGRPLFLWPPKDCWWNWGLCWGHLFPWLRRCWNQHCQGLPFHHPVKIEVKLPFGFHLQPSETQINVYDAWWRTPWVQRGRYLQNCLFLLMLTHFSGTKLPCLLLFSLNNFLFVSFEGSESLITIEPSCTALPPWTCLNMPLSYSEHSYSQATSRPIAIVLAKIWQGPEPSQWQC